MKKLMLPTVVFAAGTCLAAVVQTDISAPNLQRGEMAAAEDVAFSGRLVRATESLSLDKTGPGDWTLSPLGLYGLGGFGVNVLDGVLTVSDTGDRTLPAAAAPAATATAALWLKSDTNVTFREDGTSVATWYDARESGSGSSWGSVYYRVGGKIAGLEGDVYPTARTDEQGRRYVYCNGAKSGSYLIFQQPSGTDFTSDLKKIRHVFLLARFTDSYGWPLGNLGTSCYFYPYPDDGSLNGTVYAFLPRCSPYATAGRYYRDAVRIDPSAEKVATGVQLLEWESSSTDNTIELGCFFRDRNRHTDTKWGVHNGGDDIGEVLIFTNALTVAERMDVENYLMAKWLDRRIVPEAYAPSVSRGKKAVVESADSVCFGDGRPVVPTGDGVLEKSGDGTALLMEDAAWRHSRSAADSASLSVEGGSLDVNVGDVTVSPKGGKGLALTPRMNDLPSLAAASASAGEASYAGDTAYRVASFGEDVEKLSVKADKLVLTSPESHPSLPASGAVESTFVNPGFETATPTVEPNTAYVTQGGWWFHTLSGGRFYNLTLPTPTRWMIMHPYPAPEGTHALSAIGGFACGTTAAVPVAGRYELSFMSCKQGDAKAVGVDVLIIQAGVTNKLAVCRPVHWNGFERNCYKTPWLEAGDCEIILSHLQDNNGSSHFDDFHLRRCAEESASVFPVPNGSFENATFPDATSTASMADAFSVQVANGAEGWMFAQDPTRETIRSPFVCAVSRFMNGYYRPDGSAYGGVQLGLFRSGGTATSPTFRLPAGRWALRMKLARWCAEQDNETWWWKFTGSEGAYLTGAPVVSAKLVGDDETELGTLTGGMTTKTLVCPTVVESDGSKDFRLVLCQTVDTAAALVDDLEFVSVDSASLVRDGGFDVMSNWTYSDGTATWVLPNKWYGFSSCGSSERFAALTDSGSVRQSVTFPANGLYRLTFMLRSRADVSDPTALMFGYGYNQVRACLETESALREIGRTPHILATNFVQQAFCFKVDDAPCTKTLILQGCNGLALADGTVESTMPADFPSGAMKTAQILVDEVELVQQTEALGEAPDIPETVDISLGAKTRLQLDFNGQKKVGRLRLGGHRVYGVIDASHPSGLVSGPGSLFVERLGGLVITVR